MDIKELYAQRLLVFLETAPQSNQYRQVMLTADQYKNVSDSIVTIVDAHDANDMEGVTINLYTDVYPLPDLKDIN